jgi:SNF2 family DNA or RNA helicase
MDANPEAQEEFDRLLNSFSKKIQDDDTRQQSEEGSFEELEFFYNQAKDSYESRDGPISSDEETISVKLKEQYESRQAKQKQSEGFAPEDLLDGSKRRKEPFSHMFVQQSGTGHNKEADSAIDMTRSKRKRGETSENPSKSSRPVGMTETVKDSLKRLIADAPSDKRQAAVQDGVRVLRTIKQFREGSVRYSGEGTWTVEGVVTPIKTHQLIHAGWMNEREASSGGPKRGILADKMGLCKTLCSLTSMVHGKVSVGPRSSRTNLVVVPKLLKDQWINKARKHTVQPISDNLLGLNHVLPYSSESSSDTQMLLFKSTDLIVVTYTELSSTFKNVIYPPGMDDDAEKESYFNDNIRPTLPAIFQFKFRAIYLDVGHSIRNVTTKWALACHKLMSKFRWSSLEPL